MSVALHLPEGLSALRHRNYALYFAGQFTSQLGTWIEQTAVSWILYELTDSPLLLGLGGLFRALPLLTFSLLGGAVADRVPRRTLLLVTESLMLLISLAIGLLAFLGRLQFWHLYISSFLAGCLSAFSIPSRHAMFPGLVPRGELHSAVTFNAVSVRCAGLLGPSLAGIALAGGGYVAPFLLNAVSFLGMLAALLAMRLPDQPEARARPATLRRGVAEGLSFVSANPVLLVVLGLEILAGLFGHNTALITIFARDVLQVGPEGLGVLLSALGAGALCGMLVLTLSRVRRQGRLILVAGSCYVLAFVLFGLSRAFPASVALLFALGASDGVWAVTRNTVAQLVVPDALRGRVMSVVVLVTRGSTPLGQLMAGAVAGLAGGPGAVLLGACAIGLGLAGGGLKVPAFRRFNVP